MTSKYVGAATIATSLLWTLGTRTNSNLIEGISRNNDLYNKQWWVSNPNLIEARQLIGKIVFFLEKDQQANELVNELVYQLKNSLPPESRLRMTVGQYDLDEAERQVWWLLGLKLPAAEDQSPLIKALIKAKKIQTLLNTDLAIKYYDNSLRPGLLPYENPANVTDNARDFITTSPNYYTKDSGALKITQSTQLDCLAYSTQAVSGWTALQTDNPLYLLLNLIPLTVLSYDITKNYLNLEKGYYNESR